MNKLLDKTFGVLFKQDPNQFIYKASIGEIIMHKAKVAALAMFYGLAVSMPALADDTEIYSSSAAVPTSVQPNVLFLLDTSNSMGNEAGNITGYDATQDYSDAVNHPSSVTACFDPNKIYRLEDGNATKKAKSYCNSGENNNDARGSVLISKFFCADATSIVDQNGSNAPFERADSTGFYTGRMGRYVSGANKNSQRWQKINFNNSNVLECKGDIGEHGKQAGSNRKYATKIGGKSGNARWTSNFNDRFFWSNIGTHTLYTGNYLNYLITTGFFDSFRIEVIRDAMINFVNSASGINLGFMPYSKNKVGANNHSEGGMIEVAVDDIVDTRADIIQRLRVYGTQHDAQSLSGNTGHKNLIFGTPSSRQYYEALRYFKGDAPVYGVNSKGPSLTSSIIDDPDGISGGATTPVTTVAFPSTPDSLDPDGTYKSPVENECQRNYVILLTDGLPFADSIGLGQLSEMGITDTEGLGGESCTVDPGCVTGGCKNTCLPLFAKAGAILESNDNASLTEIQPISTFTIGFGLDPNTTGGQRAIRALNDSADISKEITEQGESFLADNAEDLREHLRSIIEALDVPSTFSSPAVSVNAFNRTVHLDDLFFTLFVPGEGSHWDGNLKKYKLKVKADADDIDGDGDTSEIIPFIEDDNDIPAGAIDFNTGFFKATSKSFWSASADGEKVIFGGAVENIGSRTDRKVYTYTGNYTTVGDVEKPNNTIIITADNKVAASNKAKVTDDMLGIDTTDTTKNGLGDTVDLHDALLDWASGIDVLDAAGAFDGDGDPIGNDDVTDARGVMGDPLHSQPGIVQYGELSPGVADLTAFVATNDGYLHAINTETGEELWSFIPKELLPLLNTNFENTIGANKSYGLDGDVAVWIDDDNGDGTIALGTDRVILFIGQRRGGKNIYALDVTNRTVPRLLWVIKGGVPGTAYEELGQTWSTVNVEQVKDNGGTKTVLIFGGGYDTRHDNDDPAVLPRKEPSATLDPVRDDSVGRTVFIADALTGNVIWSAGKGGASPTSKMEYAIPARVKPLDVSGDGNIDRLYVADLGGQIFRFDFDETALKTSSFSAASITGGRIWDLSTDDVLADARRFYYPPDVALVAERGKPLYLGLSISSGYRAHPNNTDINDRIYLLKDEDVFTAPSSYVTLHESDLFPVTTNDASLPDSPNAAQIATSKAALTSIGNANGWFIDLDNEATPPVFIGEKGLAETLIIEGSLIVTTFLPETGAGANSCAPKEGTGSVFFLDIVDGTASYPSDADSRSDRKRKLKKGGIPASPNVIITSDAVPTVCIGTECESLGGSVGLRKTFWYEVEK